MTTRYVHAKRGKASGSFDGPIAPAGSVADALKVAKAGDTIEIQGNDLARRRAAHRQDLD